MDYQYINHINGDDEHSQPSGSSGLILGEILGRRAGLTKVDVTLFRFLDERADFGSIFLLLPGRKAGLVGEFMALSIGLGVGTPTRADAPEGVCKGPSFGVFRADNLGVSWSPFCIAVSIRESCGRSRDASGNVRSSSAGGASASPNVGDGWMRIRDAGVAGATPGTEA